MNESEINKSVGKLDGYLGTFARNELESLKISHYPSYIIVNLDTREGGGSHWIAIAMHLIIDDYLLLLPLPYFHANSTFARAIFEQGE